MTQAQLVMTVEHTLIVARLLYSRSPILKSIRHLFLNTSPGSSKPTWQMIKPNYLKHLLDQHKVPFFTWKCNMNPDFSLNELPTKTKSGRQFKRIAKEEILSSISSVQTWAWFVNIRYPLWIERVTSTEVTAPISHQWGLGSNPRGDTRCGWSLLLFPTLTSKGLTTGIMIFPSPQNPVFLNSDLIRNGRQRITVWMCYL